MDNRKNCPDLQALLDYAEEKGLIEQDDRTYCFNRLLQILGMDAPLEEAENPAACREEGQTTSPPFLTASMTGPWKRASSKTASSPAIFLTAA